MQEDQSVEWLYHPASMVTTCFSRIFPTICSWEILTLNKAYCHILEVFWLASDWVCYLKLALGISKFQDADIEVHLVSVRTGDWFVTIDLRMRTSTSRSSRDRNFLRFAFGTKLTSTVLLALTLWTFKVYGCVSGRVVAPGCPNFELPGRLADISLITGLRNSSTSRFILFEDSYV